MDSKYNQRRSECETALEIINTHRPVRNLCEATIEQIDMYLNDDIIKRRARHAVTENLRVAKAVEVLRKGDIEQFGKLLNASHASLKEDYQVSGFELDSLVEGAQAQKSCLGARMTGAGFGGCAIAIVEDDGIDNFKASVKEYYKNKTGITADFYISVIGDGVKRI